MKSLFCVFLIFISYLGVSQTYSWGKNYGSGNEDFGTGVPVSAGSTILPISSNNETIVVGKFQDSIAFNGVEKYGHGNYDVFVSKLDKNGTSLWSQVIGGSEDDDAIHAVTDGNDEIFLAGKYFDLVDLNPAGSAQSVFCGSEGAALITKYTSSGILSWYMPFLASSTNKLTIQRLATFNDGSLIVAGTTVGVIDFNPLGVTHNVSTTNKVSFYAKYTSVGALDWVNVLDEAITISDISIDNQDNFICSGYFSSPVDVDPSSNSTLLTSQGSRDILLLKYTSNGTFVWGHSMGSYGVDQGSAVCLDNQDNVYLGGTYSNTVDFDPSGTTSTLTNMDFAHSFYAKYSPIGALQWVFDTPGDNKVSSIKIVNNKHLVAIGTLSGGQNDFDPSSALQNLTAPWQVTNGFFAAYTISQHNYVFAHNIGVSNQVQPHDLKVKGLDVYLTGGFFSTVDMDFTSATQTVSSRGKSDVFVTKYLMDITTTDLTEVSFSSKYWIFPNPAPGVFTLNDEGYTDLKLFDVRGKQLGYSVGSQNTVRLNEKYNGVVFVRYINNNGNAISKKITCFY